MRTKHAAAAVLSICSAVALSAAVTMSTANPDQKSLMKEAKVSKEAATKTALDRAPGKVESAELEREHGALIWSFDIRNAKGTIDEVAVDAKSGKIVAVEAESKKQEAAEKKKEAAEKKSDAQKKHPASEKSESNEADND